MTVEEIFQKSKPVIGLEGMTVNERLWSSGLMEAFDKAKKNDKALAEMILMALKVDRVSINRILK